MNVSEYAAYFHDGSLIGIECINSEVVFSIESAEISMEENKDNIVLSEHSTIKGKLHLEGIKSITDGDKPFLGKMQMLHDSAGILRLEICAQFINLYLEWINYPPHPETRDYSFYTINAEKIWWENIPDLFDPFW